MFLPNVDLLDARDQVALVQLINSLSGPDHPRILASASPSWDTEATTSGDATSQELYYRLAVLELRVPPLRERPDDIETLLSSWVGRRAKRLGVEPPRPSPEQLRALRLHAWPGNLRELAAVAERAVVFGAEAYSIKVQPVERPDASLPELAEGFELAKYLEDLERTLLIRAIDQTDGDRGAMSRILGVERNTLRYKLNKYGLLDRT
ncbi:MAG: hypothetical protein H6740_11250 [Alphaproteobacteria bacterium]|nr:hypothetical protein [Alphaproteobacteria bacterium]